MSQVVASQRDTAEVVRGDALCKQKMGELLDKVSLPRGLLPLDGVEEVGHDAASGFVWLKQVKKKEHRFKKIGRTVSYDTEVTAVVGDRRMQRLTGVKSKEILLWVPLSEIYLDSKDPTKITFTATAGLSRTFPVSAFEAEEEEKGKDELESKK